MAGVIWIKKKEDREEEGRKRKDILGAKACYKATYSDMKHIIK